MKSKEAPTPTEPREQARATATRDAQNAPQGAGAGDLAPQAQEASAARCVVVSLSETTILSYWRDPRTGLVVTREPKRVPIAMIGEATRQSTSIDIKEAD